MRHFALGSVLLLASAQLTLAAIIDVTVGGPGVLKFSPQNVNATVGDTIRFHFQQKNHTITQSSLNTPCSPLVGGFDSGFMPVADNPTTGFPTAELKVTKTTPVYAYCRQGTHCHSGMVFGLNAPDFDKYLSAATGSLTSPSVPSTSAPVPTSSGIPSSNDHRIAVGGNGIIAFNPPNITAQVGDTITFEFHQKNHTVTASSFDTPCSWLQGGFDSGFQPVADGIKDFPTYVVQVNDTKPIWAYCMQGNHCAQGMVFAANAPDSKNFAAFQSKAKNSTSQSGGYGTPSSAWRPTVGSSSMVVVLGLFAATLL